MNTEESQTSIQRHDACPPVSFSTNPAIEATNTSSPIGVNAFGADSHQLQFPQTYPGNISTAEHSSSVRFYPPATKSYPFNVNYSLAPYHHMPSAGLDFPFVPFDSHGAQPGSSSHSRVLAPKPPLDIPGTASSFEGPSIKQPPDFIETVQKI